MQEIERTSVTPPALQSGAAGDGRRRLRDFFQLPAARRAQTPVPPPGLRAEDHELISALAAMTDGRCAFCEARDDLIVHRHRPAGNALPLESKATAHLYYAWLGDAWQNLYPCCRGCLPPEPQFPVIGSRAAIPSMSTIHTYVERGDGLWPNFPPKEQALLLDPAYDTMFEKHLLPKLDGELIGQSRRGDTTVQVHDLNRPDRRNQRFQIYQERLARLRQFVRGLERDTLEPDWDDLFDFSRLDFGGSWFLVLRRIARAVGGSSGVRWRTSRGHIRAFFVKVSKGEDPLRLVDDAVEALRREDEELRPGRWGTDPVLSVRIPVAAVEIDNFKAIERLELTFTAPPIVPDVPGPRAPSLVILGENATGKSSILEAIALALASKEARDALDPPWSRLTLDATQLDGDRAASPRHSEVKVTFADRKTVVLNIDRGTAVVRSAFGNQQVPVFAYGAFRRFLTGTRRPSPHKHIRNLFDGSTLSNPEPWLNGLSADNFKLVIRTLHGLLSLEGAFDVIEKGRGGLKMVTSITDPDGQARYNKTPLQSVSSGYRSMLAMLCDIMRGLLDPQVYEKFESFETAQGIVLIDEIEAHLHPRWKVQVMTSLRTALPGMTFIVTTHDPLCLRGMGNGEVAVLQRVTSTDSAQQSQLPILVEQIKNLPQVADLRIEQLLTSDFFQLLSSDDAASDRRLARLADLMRSKQSNSLGATDAAVLGKFEADIAEALPVGSSEVHQLVQAAVAEYLQNRRDASSQRLRKLRAKAKTEILTALETL